MKKIAIEYSPTEMEMIQEFISGNFGASDGMLYHEIKSEYIHTDVDICNDNNNNRIFVTFGMGARKMNSPFPKNEYAELLMYASPEIDAKSSEALTVVSELQSLTKYPFREKTFFASGHTINVSSRFKEKFGYDYVVFYDTRLSFNNIKPKKIKFLLAIPVYKEERDWMVENDSFTLIKGLVEKYGEKAYLVDCKRDVYIPGNAVSPEDASLMNVLGIDYDTLERLRDFLVQKHEAGEKVSYEIIGKWIEENS